MPDYQSVFEGKQIDEGIGKIINGGIDKAVLDAQAAAGSAAADAEKTAADRVLADNAQKAAASSAVLAQKAVGDVGWGYFKQTVSGHIHFVRNDVGHPPAFVISKTTGKMEVSY